MEVNIHNIIICVEYQEIIIYIIDGYDFIS